MILHAAMAAGFDYASAMTSPISLVEDVIATHQIFEHGYKRIFTDPKDIEDDFRRMMSAR